MSTDRLQQKCCSSHSYGPYKNSQFEYCQRLPLPRFVLSCFLFHRMVWNGIPRVCFHFCFTERNSELFSLPLKGFGRDSKSLLLFLVHGTEFRVIFSSAEGFGTEFRDFLFRGIAGIPSEITLCSVYSVFRGIIFLSEIPNPSGRGYSQPLHTLFPARDCSRHLGHTPL